MFAFDHDSREGFGAGIAQEKTPAAFEFGFNLARSTGDFGHIREGLFLAHRDVDENLRVADEAFR